MKGTKKNDDDSINEGHQKRQPLLNSNYVFLPLMYLNTIGNEIKSNLLSVVCATHQPGDFLQIQFVLSSKQDYDDSFLTTDFFFTKKSNDVPD